MDTVPVTSSILPSAIFYSLMVLSAILTAIYFYIENSRMVRYGRKLPGPPTIPFFGNILMALNIQPKDLLKKALSLDIYGNVTRAFVGKELVVFLKDPRDVELVLGSHVHITKSPEYRFFKPWLGDGLLISNGQKWYSHRKIIAPAFHMSILKSFVPLFYDNSLTLVKRLKDQVGKEFDCHDYLSTVTVDILVQTAMGVKRKNKEKTSFGYAKAVMEICNIIHIRQYSVFLRFDKYFQWTKYAMKQTKNLNTIHDLSSNIIKEKKLQALNSNVVESNNKSQNNDKTKSDDTSEIKYTNLYYVKDDLDEIDENDVGLKKRSAFLDHLLEVAKNSTNLTEEEVKEEVDTIMFEGHDTTAAASSFILCVLGVEQDIQNRVMEELNMIFGNSDRPCTFQDTIEMKYLERVILETLRLFPPVPAIARILHEDLQLASTNKILPSKCRVVILQYLIHRLPEYYPNPDVFNPDNFLPEKMQQRHYYSYIPFSAGPRSCVGRKFALLKLKVLISTILRNYKIMADVPYSQFQLQVDIILKRSDGFSVRIEPRDKISSEIRV